MRLFGLIGFPLSHSFSAGYFSEKFSVEKIQDCEYRNFPIPALNELPDVLEKHPELNGLNVTIPYKEKIIEFLDEIQGTAQKIGAVNTIRIDRNPSTGSMKLTGFNTDADGFLTSLNEILPPGISHALVLGTGGASKAIIFSLKKIGIKPLVVSRKPGKNQVSYSDLDQSIMNSHRLIINTTPLGTYPDTQKAPDIPYHLLTENHLLHDLVYNPSETLFMKNGALRGAKTRNGYPMLVAQAELSWKIWNTKGIQL